MRQDDSTVRKADARDLKLKLIDEVISMYHTTRLSNVPAAIHILSKPTVQQAFKSLESSPADGDGGAIPEGMVLVPREPTEAMLAAAAEAFPRSASFVFPKIWRAMLSAITPTETGEQGKALGEAEG